MNHKTSNKLGKATINTTVVNAVFDFLIPTVSISPILGRTHKTPICLTVDSFRKKRAGLVMLKGPRSNCVPHCSVGSVLKWWQQFQCLDSQYGAILFLVVVYGCRFSVRIGKLSVRYRRKTSLGNFVFHTKVRMVFGKRKPRHVIKVQQSFVS